MIRLRTPTLSALLLLAACAAPGARAQEESEAPQEQRTVLDAVFTADQASRGKAVFDRTCLDCHFYDEFEGFAFQRAWDGRPLHAFYDLVSTRMPEDNPGSLKRSEYVDVIAYILAINAYPAGDVELTGQADVLKSILIRKQPESGGR